MPKISLLNQLREVYQDTKVFLTGHTGFKGSWMLILLHLLKAKVQGYALASTQQSMYQHIEANRLCQSHIGDIRDAASLQRQIESFQPNFIFHFAAQPLVLDSYCDPLYTLETNTMGTAYLLEAAKSVTKPCQILVITTDKVYQNREWVYAYRETDRLGGQDPYSSSKACAELLADSYRNSFFHPKSYKKHQKSLATARAGNVIGGGDWAENRIIPDIIRSLSQNKPIAIRNPDAVRPWQHVLEALTGYLILGLHLSKEPESTQYNSSWNFSPTQHENISVKNLVEHAIACWGSGGFFVSQQIQKFHETNLLKLDCSKAIKYLDWKPRMNTLQAIEMSVSWYKAAAQKNPFRVSVMQAKKYLSHVSG